MKLKNIIIGGLGLLSLSACNDYLDVEAPSKFLPEDITPLLRMQVWL